MSKVVEVVITAKHKVNHDSYIYSFQFSTEKILFQIGQHFRILQNLKTFDHPEGEDLVRKYTPINPCSRTVQTYLFRIPSTFWSKFIDPMSTLNFPMEENIHHIWRHKMLEINLLLKDLLEDLTTKVMELQFLV